MIWYELGSGKAFDSGAPLGPCIVTADEIADPQNLKVMSRVNGELRQSSSTSNMIWSCAELIHFFSRNFTLRPGMVIITGTPAVGDPRASQPGVAVLKKPVDVKALDETIKEKLRQRPAVRGCAS
jgi:2-keto-4-pentenoate hydratase/2-oxohepta-3-ene-1,7-dioic acid hydratase in catechol pathway